MAFCKQWNTKAAEIPTSDARYPKQDCWKVVKQNIVNEYETWGPFY